MSSPFEAQIPATRARKPNRGKLPAPNPAVFPQLTGLRWVTALEVTTEIEFRAGQPVEVEVISARFDPPRAWLEARAGGPVATKGHRKIGALYLPSGGGQPRRLELWVPRVRPLGGGKPLRLLPEGFDPVTGVHPDLRRELHRNLFDLPIAKLQRRTGLSQKRIRTIALAIIEEEWAAIARDRPRVVLLALDGAHAAKAKGQTRVLLTVVASDPTRDLRYLVGLTELPVKGKGGTEASDAPVVDALAKILKKLPGLSELIAVATDDDPRIRRIVRDAFATAGLALPRLVLDRWHAQDRIRACLSEVRLEKGRAARAARAARRRAKGPGRSTELRRRKRTSTRYESLPSQLRIDLERTYWRDLALPQPDEKPADKAEREARWADLKRLFASDPLLCEAYWALQGFREIYHCHSRALAAATFEAWQRNLAPELMRLFQPGIAYIKRNRESFLGYFEALELTAQRYGRAYSLTGGPVEAMNGQLKERWARGRAAEVKLLLACVLAEFGYRRRVFLAKYGKPKKGAERPDWSGFTLADWGLA